MPQTLLLCDLDLQFQGHWWSLKGQILAIFSHFGTVLIYRKLDHPMAVIYKTYFIIYVLYNTLLYKVIHRPSKYLTEVIFGEIFGVNALRRKLHQLCSPNLQDVFIGGKLL